MPDIGPPMTWRLELDNQITRGAAEAKASINGVEQAGNKATGSMSVLDNANRKNAAGFRAVGSVAMMAGAGIMSAGIAAQASGGDMATLAPIIIGVGGAMTALGSISMITGPLIKAVGWAHSTAVPQIMAFVAAQWQANAALTALAGATIVGAAIAGLWLLYNAMNSAKNNAAELEKEIKRLNQTADEMKYIQAAADDKLKGLKDTLDKSGNSVKDLKQDYDDLNTAMGKQLDIADKLRHAPLEIADAQQALKDASTDLVKAMQSGDSAEITRARNRRNNAKEALDDALRNKKAVEDEDKANREQIKTLEDKNKVTSSEGLKDKLATAEKTQAEQQEAYNKQLLITEEIENRVKANDFYTKLIEWQKAGVTLTEEDKAAFANGPDYMKSAYSRYSGNYATTTKNPNYLKNIFGMPIEQGTAAYNILTGQGSGSPGDQWRNALLQGSQQQWSALTTPNPNAGGMQSNVPIIIEIKGTVTDRKITLNQHGVSVVGRMA
jgi:uncharacterized protein YoxC